MSTIIEIGLKVALKDDEESAFENGRLFIRNLPYTCKEEDLEALFSKYKPVVEVNMPIDNFSKKPKGFAYITFMFPEHALKAFNDLDGSIFQGRMLHIIPAKSKDDATKDTADDGGIVRSVKQKREMEKKKQAQKGHNWNTLFVNQDSLANLMSHKYNVDKSEIFDVQNSKKSVAVRLAVGETQIVNDMRKFLIRNGVKLDAFSNADGPRSKTTILIKNLPINTSDNEIRELFEKYGLIRRIVMPEYGIAALIEFKERQEAREAFTKLAYRKFKNVPLYLEWAPMDVFDGDKDAIVADDDEPNRVDNQTDADQMKTTKRIGNITETADGVDKKPKDDHEDDDNDGDDDTLPEPNSTLFIKNLNFATNESALVDLFKKIGKCKATIARKISPKNEVLSMGYGFVEFKTHASALGAIKKFQDHELDGHKLELKLSTKQVNNVENGNDTNGRTGTKRGLRNIENTSKILVRNIPFEAKTKEIEELFKVFGELKYVRLPKKIDGTHRGFGFVEFLTKNEAKVGCCRKYLFLLKDFVYYQFC
jgi:multiple RNA-binding domain-containing protein 1